MNVKAPTNPATGQDAIELVLGRAVTTEAGEHEGLVHLWWRVRVGVDDVIQVYVNDELVEVSHDPLAPELWLVLDRSRPQRIELLGVPRAAPEAWWRPRPERLARYSPRVSDRTQVRLLRDESLPIDTRVEVRREDQLVAAGEMWPNDTHRSGFGGLFGVGAFGRDSAAGPGLGRGELGHGPLGTDATAWATAPIPLTPGQNKLTVHATDTAGRDITPPFPLPSIAADTLPEPASDLTISPDFTLAWTP
ncbi:MAG: hypothetical protein AAF333_16920 [Planctomycetota bacterium]